VDGVFITHPDADHMNGILELLEAKEEENIDIKRIYIYENGLLNEPQSWEELVTLAEEREIPVYGIGQGDILLTESFRMECLYPLDGQCGLTGNASSLVMSVESGTFSAIFTGDLEKEGERILLDAYEDTGLLAGQKECDLLKVAHHGSSNSTSVEFLQWINPKYAIISCGKDNSYGHPHKEVLMRLETEEIPYRITYEEGAVCITE